FILSLICLIISAKLFYQLGIYVDEANTSPSVVLGGNFGVWLEWTHLALIGAISVLSGIQLFHK
ncbi:MAG: hypothetical protein ACLTC1_09055, partial [Turicibacter sp.]